MSPHRWQPSRLCNERNPSPVDAVFIPKHFYASTHFIAHMPSSPGVWQMVAPMRKDTAGRRPQSPPHQPGALILGRPTKGTLTGILRVDVPAREAGSMLMPGGHHANACMGTCHRHSSMQTPDILTGRVWSIGAPPPVPQSLGGPPAHCPAPPLGEVLPELHQQP